MQATKETEHALSDPADALRRIDEVLRLSRSAVWEVDRHGVYTYASASHEELLGYRPEELVGLRTIHDFYPDDLPDELRAELQEDWIGAGEEYSQLELPLVAKSGEVVWVTSHGKPIFGPGGDVIGFRGADIDITARKKGEHLVRSSEQLLWQQIHEAPVPMAWTTLSGAPGDLHVNRAFVGTFGYEPAEIPTIEAWFAKAYPDEEYRARVLRDTAELLAQSASGGRDPASREYRITCKDGRVLDIEIAASSMAGRFIGTFVDVTVRRRQLEEQRAREEELQRVLDYLPFPVATSVVGPDIVWSDPGAKVTYVNRSFTAMFGYSLEDMPTIADCARLFYPDDEYRGKVFAELDRQVQSALATGAEVGPVESRIMSKSGEKHDVVIKALAVGDRLVISLEDVTERKRAMRELEESGQRLREVIENTPVPVSYTREGGRVLAFNKAFADAYGWREEDVPTYEEWFRKIYPDPDYRREVLAVWDADVQRARQSDGKIAARLYRLTAKDGSVREVEISAAILAGEMFGTFLDMTERNRAERLLRASESSLRALIDNAPVGIVRLHLPTGRLWLNKEFTDLLGYTDADVPTMDEWMLRAYPDGAYRREILAKWQRDLAEAGARDGRLAPAEVRVFDKAAREHEMQFSAVIMGQEVFCLWVDLTERNRAERLLREQREQLAHVGRVSALGQLAASLAHELDQPLGAILNNAETARMLLAAKKPDHAELAAIVQDILEDDRRAGAVLDRIRSMVQRQSFQAGAVHLPPLCREVATLVQPAAAKRGITLEISCEPGMPPVEGDRVLLQQALLNLLLNSIDALGARTDGRIEVRAGQANENDVEISVGDNAGGVPSGEVERLLEPFQTTKEGGLGMGLPIVQSIAEQHGGRLRIDNQPGRGLTVHLVLPRWRGPEVT